MDSAPKPLPSEEQLDLGPVLRLMNALQSTGLHEILTHKLSELEPIRAGGDADAIKAAELAAHKFLNSQEFGKHWERLNSKWGSFWSGLRLRLQLLVRRIEAVR